MGGNVVSFNNRFRTNSKYQQKIVFFCPPEVGWSQRVVESWVYANKTRMQPGDHSLTGHWRETALPWGIQILTHSSGWWTWGLVRYRAKQAFTTTEDTDCRIDEYAFFLGTAKFRICYSLLLLRPTNWWDSVENWAVFCLGCTRPWTQQLVPGQISSGRLFRAMCCCCWRKQHGMVWRDRSESATR